MPQPTLRPLRDNVIVETPTNKITPGGIQLPDSHVPEQGRGRVLAVGPGTYDLMGNHRPVNVNPGYSIWYVRWQEMKLGGVTYHIVQEADIMAVIEDA